MDATITDILRRLHNLIRLGTIAEISAQGDDPRVRVASGGLLTDWLPWATGRSGATRDWNPPTTGEQVVMFSPSGDLTAAVVFPAVPSDAFPPPTTDPNLTVRRYPDGAVVSYDHQNHQLRAELPEGGSAEIVAPGKVRLVTPLIEATGDIHADGDVVAGGISLRHHKTSGVMPGSGTSGEPV